MYIVVIIFFVTIVYLVQKCGVCDCRFKSCFKYWKLLDNEQYKKMINDFQIISTYFSTFVSKYMDLSNDQQCNNITTESEIINCISNSKFRDKYKDLLTKEQYNNLNIVDETTETLKKIII